MIMKKTCTIFLLSLAFSAFAQVGKEAKETSQKGTYFKQNNEKIEIVGNNLATGGYTLKSDKDGAIGVTPYFSSPNDVLIVKDVLGNEYWVLIDGTIVKYVPVAEGRGANSKSTPSTSVSTGDNVQKIAVRDQPKSFEKAVVQKEEGVKSKPMTDPDMIVITADEVGDTSQLFEKRYDDMTRKEKKEYKENEKKIMKQLEQELKDREGN